MLMVRKQRAMEEHVLAARDADRREVLDLQVADLVGVVLDVEPAERGIWEALRERHEAPPVFDAGVAPLGAEAGDGIVPAHGGFPARGGGHRGPARAGMADGGEPARRALARDRGRARAA